MITSTVTVIAGMAIRARRPLQIGSPTGSESQPLLKKMLKSAGGVLQKPALLPVDTHSQAPLEFGVSVTEGYRRIHEMLSRGSISAYAWTITDAIEDAYIVAELKYDNSATRLTLECLVNFDFSEMTVDHVTIRWSCRSLNRYSVALAPAFEEVINKFINTCLEQQLPDPIIGQSTPTIPELSRHGHCKSAYPKDFAYSKLLQKLSSPDDRSTQWRLKACFKGRSISADVEYQQPHDKAKHCQAEVFFEFRDDGGESQIDWTYKFNREDDFEVLQSFKNLTDDWLQLVLRR